MAIYSQKARNKMRNRKGTRKLNKMQKTFIIRKLTICIISLIVAAKALWEVYEWALEMQRSKIEGFWFVVFLFAVLICIYFWEETYTDYKKKRKRRR